MKILDLLKTKRKVQNIERVYEPNEKGYEKLANEDKGLYYLSRGFVLDYAQNWDKDEQKKSALKDVFNFVGLPLNNKIEDRKTKNLKREFKKALRETKREDLKLHVVEVANVLLHYKKNN
jgi:hypothetical protein